MKSAKDINVLTNADRIRGMSDKELARFIFELCDDWNGPPILDWLQQPAETEGTE